MSNNTAKGVVQRLHEKDFGGKILHSFTLQGITGFFGTGTRKPPVEIGKSYEFEYYTDPRGRNAVNLATLRPWESGEVVQAAPSNRFKAASVGGKSSGSDEFWKNKEAREVRNDSLRELGATRNTALTLVSLMLQNGAIKLPAKENLKEKAIYECFEHYTSLLLKGKVEESTGPTPDPEVPTESPETGEDSEWK